MAFESYVAAAALGLRDASAVSATQLDPRTILNGAPYKVFRQSIGLDERRKAGTFFSGEAIANRLAALLTPEIPAGGIVMDPTCGMGDLLLAYAATLPLASTLAATLKDWGAQLAGMDLSEDLVRMTKIRLSVLARTRGGFQDSVDEIDSHFPLIAVGNALDAGHRFAGVDGFLFNPPFGQVQANPAPAWASGQINAAALFLDALLALRPDATIAAVLPEVLRCGSRYERFRAHLKALGLSGPFTSLGRFDAWTDVDVYSTLLSARDAGDLWPSDDEIVSDTVGSRFEIRVGAVVPHRHKNRGPWRPFLCAKTTPAWSAGYESQAHRRFTGTVFEPPFVVVRRTSSPSDRLRAVGSIVTGTKAVAVENHLIVVRPMSADLESCRALLEVLKRPETTAYLNRVIRCRHLTTASVASIPWSVENG